MKHRLASALVRLYPAAWRREYGAELTDLLVNRPFGVGALADVIWNAFGQRLRRPEPALISASAVFAMVVSLFLCRSAAFMIFKFMLGPAHGRGGQLMSSGWPRYFPLAMALWFAACAVWGLSTGIGTLRRKRWARMSIQLFGVALVLFILPAEFEMWAAPVPVRMKAVRYGLYAAQALVGVWWLFFFNAMKTKRAFAGLPAPADGSG